MQTPPDRRRFGAYPANDLGRGIPTAEASYADGYRTGATWAEAYTPGGPFVVTPYGGVPANDPDWIAFCSATAENNREWRRGFDDASATTKA